jgi:SAM-dependent methyltransferase
MDTTRANRVARHYGPAELHARIADGLRALGLDPDRLQPADLELVDQFHTGGRAATIALADLAGVRPGMRVVDLGGGLGGPARTLAAERGCDVTVLDLSEEFCRTGELLTGATGLSGQVRFHNGDALAAPFDGGSFDVVWTQHSTMNIEDKGGLYREAHRLLAPDGLFAMHEVSAGPGRQPIAFPVPWAADPDISFLERPTRMRALILAAGFAEVTWRDVTAESVAFYRERAAETARDAPPLGIHILLGPATGDCFRNLVSNAEEERIAVAQGVFRRT